VTAGASAAFVRRIRLAISDPGAILDRRDNYLEQLLSWQARAVMRVVYAEQAADVEQARRIAVALEQENAQLRELTGTAADRWAEIAGGLLVLSQAAAPGDPLGRTRADRARVLHTAARDLRWILANASLPHDLRTSEELGEPEAEPSGGAS
jgi:hypothetical protein